jgi:hypothetical protein
MRALALSVAAIAGLTFAPGAAAWAWPVDGPVLRPFVFGGDPYAASQHRGIDIGAASGASVGAPASGLVSFVGTVPGGGRAVTIRTPDGYSATLVHLGSITALRGALVDEGATVGTVGPSGDAEWVQPYVHLGIRVTAEPEGYVDPLSLLPPRPEPVAPPTGQSEPAAGPQSGAGTGATEGASEAGDGEEAAAPQAPATDTGAEDTESIDAGEDSTAAGEESGSAETGAENTGETVGEDTTEDAPTAEEAPTDADAAGGEGTGTESVETGATETPADPAAGNESAAGAADAEPDGSTSAAEAPASDAASAPTAAEPDSAAGSEEAWVPNDDPPVVDEDVPSAAADKAAPNASSEPAAAPAASADRPSAPAEPSAPPTTVSGEAAPAPSAQEAEAEAPVAEGRKGAAPSDAADAARRALEAEEVAASWFRSVGLVVSRALAHEASVGLADGRAGEGVVRAGERGASAESAAAFGASHARPHATPGSRGVDEANSRPAADRLTVRSVRGELRESTRLPRPQARDVSPEPWLFGGAVVAIALAASAVAAMRRSNRPPAPEAGADARIISILGRREPAEDPGRRRVAVCERAEAHRSRGGLRRPVGHLRALPPAERERRPDGERDGRARDAGDGRRGQRGRLAA